MNPRTNHNSADSILFPPTFGSDRPYVVTQITELSLFPYTVKVKCTLVQALRLCTGRTARSGSRDIALPFHDHGTRRGEGSASRPGRSLPRERPGTHYTGGWVGHRVGLDTCGKSRPHRIRSPDRTARSQSLYRLSYPAHILIYLKKKLRGLSPRANYTDRAAAAGRRS